MKHPIIKTIIFSIFFALAGGLKAQQFTASIDHNSVGLGDMVQVSYTLNGANGSEFQAPAFPNLRIISGPNISNSVNMGAHVSISSSYNYVLQAIKIGKAVIRPAAIKVNGSKVFSNSLEMTIVRGNNQSQNQNRGNATANLKDIFLMASANKTTVVRGEVIAVTYNLYIGNNIKISAPTITGMPTFTGFWVENGSDPKQINASHQNYKGKQYLVYPIRKILLFPQKTGKLAVDPLEIECEGQVNVPKRRDPSDPFSDMFGDFFNMDVIPFHKDIKSDPFAVNVTELPSSGKPASFSGMVGKAALSVSATPNPVKANESITYRVTIGGEGNLSLLQPIKLNLPADVEVYDPKTIDKFDRSGNNLTGTRAFVYTLIPHKAGKFDIPSLAFSFYDPAAKKYVESKTIPISVTVEENNHPKTIAVPTVSKPNESNPSLLKWGALLATTLVLVSAVLLFAKRKVKLPDSDYVQPVENYTETEYSDYLKEAQNLSLLDENDEFFTAMLNGLYAFICQTYGIPFSELSHANIQSALEQKSVPSELIKSYLNLVDQCEMVKYAPVGMHLNKAQVFNEANELIGKIKNYKTNISI